MKRIIGLLMMMALIVGAVGCSDDNNPVKSNQDLLVGTWLDEDGWGTTLRSDGTFVGEVVELSGQHCVYYRR